MARTIKELLEALNVTDASAVLFGKLPNGDSSANRDALIFPGADVFGAFSEHASIVVTAEECAMLLDAGAKNGRPTPFSERETQTP